MASEVHICTTGATVGRPCYIAASLYIGGTEIGPRSQLDQRRSARQHGLPCANGGRNGRWFPITLHIVRLRVPAQYNSSRPN
jgi:hypothetical protein